MLEAVQEKLETTTPSRERLVHLGVVFGALAAISMTAVGSSESKELVNMLQSIGNFVSLIILGVAVPNGAYGFLQYMTAGSNVDQDEKGRKRIRNTFVGLAGVAVIQVAVNVFEAMIVGDLVADAENSTSGSMAPVGDVAANVGAEAAVYSGDAVAMVAPLV